MGLVQPFNYPLFSSQGATLITLRFSSGIFLGGENGRLETNHYGRGDKSPQSWEIVSKSWKEKKVD